jgi:FkbM family methyltransferase
VIEAKPEIDIHAIFSQRTIPQSHTAFIESSKSVMIYGAGNCGRDVLRVLLHQGIPVEYFLDAHIDPGTTVQGVTVIHPDDKALSRQRRSQTCVIIAIFNRDADIVLIQESLEKYGYGNIVPFVQFHKHFYRELGDKFWLTSPGHYDALEETAERASRLWRDEKSRTLFKNILRFRMTGDYGLLSKPSVNPIYFDSDIPRWEKPMRFIDCGSFDGDTLKSLFEHYGKVQAIAAFEPDGANFHKLSSLVRTSGPYADEMVLYPCGLWSRTEQMHFSSESSESSCLTTEGGHLVQCVSIDDALQGFHPTLIKMDIEGAEYEALVGASATIIKNRPGLAVSGYHRFDHLLKIPLLLKQFDLGYEFYLRHYGHSGFDAVIYAVTQK